MFSLPTTAADQAHHEAAIAAHHQTGGRLVEFVQVVSMGFASVTTRRLHCVPTGVSPRAFGLRVSLFTLVAGWWSVPGFFITLGALAQNLSGGIDLTELVVGAASEEAFAEAERREKRKRTAVGIITAGLLFLLLAAAVGLVAYPAIRDSRPR